MHLTLHIASMYAMQYILDLGLHVVRTYTYIALDTGQSYTITTGFIIVVGLLSRFIIAS